MKNKINEFYLFKVWAMTVVIAPVFSFMLLEFELKGQMEGSGLIGFMIICILGGGLYTIPTLLFCYLIFFIIKERIISLLRLKAILILIAEISLIITNYLVWGPSKYYMNGDFSGIESTIAYCLAVIIVGILFKIELPPIPKNLSPKKPWEH